MGMLLRPEIERRLACGDIVVDPAPKYVGPNSIDLTLDDVMAIYVDSTIDMRKDNAVRWITIPDEGYVMNPGELYLCSTVERTHTPLHVPEVGGRSSIGRLGIHVHVTAGFGEVGFDGTWTLEVHVVRPVRVYPRERICQLWLFEPSSKTRPGDVEKARYDGRYQGQRGPTPSRFWVP